MKNPKHFLVRAKHTHGEFEFTEYGVLSAKDYNAATKLAEAKIQETFGFPSGETEVQLMSVKLISASEYAVITKLRVALSIE